LSCNELECFFTVLHEGRQVGDDAVDVAGPEDVNKSSYLRIGDYDMAPEPELSAEAWAELTEDLNEMLLESNVERQCKKISAWVGKYIRSYGLCFSLQESGLCHSYVYMTGATSNISGAMHRILSLSDQDDDEIRRISLHRLRQDDVIALDHGERIQSPEPTVIVIRLGGDHHYLGKLCVLTDLTTSHVLVHPKSLLSTLIPVISGLLANTIFRQHNAEIIRTLRTYQTVSSALAYVGDLQELLNTIINIVTLELPSEEGSILLLDAETNELEFYTAVGETGADLVKLRFPADRGIAGRALRERRPIIENDVQNSPDFYRSIDQEHGFKTKSLLAVPIISGDEIVGVMEAINKVGANGFNEGDQKTLTVIADEVALAIKNARLFDVVVDSYCRIRQGQGTCQGCKRPLRSWTPCAVQIGKMQ
jgi:putative methionine-R-sulfoxide reductase with GAF domain